MPVSIVVGGQFGSEGKGKVAHYFADRMKASFAVRCGGPNSGHTVIDTKGRTRTFQQLPTAAILPDVKIAICSGSYIDIDILLKEIKTAKINSNRLAIDHDAVIISKALKDNEKQSGLIKRIGSTGSGTGAALAARINRKKSLKFAKDIPELNQFIHDVPKLLRDSLDKNERILIEGTQGFGLSPLHSRLYPYVTSRDTTASAFASETGLSPIDVDDIILTIRSFPIRVAGNSGPFGKPEDEIDWETVTTEGGHKKSIKEKTTVTKKIRRVARFSPEIVKKAIVTNRPTKIILNHMDYVCSDIKNKRVNKFIEMVERSINHHVDYLGFGPASIVQKQDYRKG